MQILQVEIDILFMVGWYFSRAFIYWFYELFLIKSYRPN